MWESFARAERAALGFAALTLILVVSHFGFLDHPYFWDELGQFVPSALDIYQSGSLVPESALPNVHPPGVMAYLAGAWSLAGYSIRTTRVAMLMLAAVGLLATFLLARRLAPERSYLAGLFAIVLLYISPLVWSQAMLANLDMPAMVFTTLALYFFLEERWKLSVAACTAAVLMKETALIVPLVLAAWLLRERKARLAALFAIPALPLAGWVALLWSSTGHALGNSEFSEYNLTYPLHPVRLLGALLRRAYYLFVANFHWVGVLTVVLAWREREYRNRDWAVAGSVFLANALAVTLLGGAVLERYLLPALPILYTAIAVSWLHLGPGRRMAAQAAMVTGMAACLWANPPYPFPFENNLAWTDFVALHQDAGLYLDHNAPGVPVTTAWPLTDALRRPEFGFVSQSHPVVRIPDFRRSSVEALREPPKLFVLYTRTWDPEWGLLRQAWVQRLLGSFWGYETEVGGEELRTRFGLQRAAHWERRGQSLEIWSAGPVTALRTSP